MKIILSYLFLISILLLACADSESSEETERFENESIEMTAFAEEVGADENTKDSKLESLVKNDESARQLLKALQSAIENKNEIKSVKDIENVLGIRDSLIHQLLANDDFVSYMENEDRLYSKFKKLGIHVIEGEGFFFGLEQAPLLTDVIEKVANEPFRLKNEIENLYGLSMGSVYPYFDISEEMNIVPLAEKMLTKYPGHKYNKRIVEIMDNALAPLIDVHQLTGEHIRYIVGGYDVNDYPGATDISFHKKFITEAKGSRYAEIVSKVVNSISTLEAREFDMLYFVEVPDLNETDSVFSDNKLNLQLDNLPEELTETDSWFKYLWLGVDVANMLYLREGDENRKVFIYRFFDKKEPAEKSLKVIQKVIPSAKLIEYELTESDKKHKN